MANKQLIKGYTDKLIPLTDAELDALCNCIEVNSYDKNIRVTDIGEVENNVHLVVRGIVRQYFYRQKYEITTNIAQEGKLICSYFSFFKSRPSGEIVETIEPSTLYTISRENIERLCEKYPLLEKLYSAAMTQAFLNSELRAREKLIKSGKVQFVQFMEQNRDLFMRVPQKHLASYLNIKPETFSRLKHLLVQKKNSLVPI